MKRFALIVLVLLCFVPTSHAQDSQPPRSIMLERSVEELVWSPNSRYIAFLASDDNYDTNVQVVEVSTGQLVADFDYDPRIIAWSPDSTRLAVDAVRDTGEHVFYGLNNSISVTILNIHTGEEQFLGNDVDINSLAWSPDGTQLAITTAEYVTSDAYRSAVQIWDASTGETVATLDDGARSYINYFWYSPTWSPDGMRLAVLNVAGTVAVWDVSRQEQEYEIGGFLEGANVVAWCPSGDLLAASNGNVIRTWNATNGEPLTVIQGNALDLRWTTDDRLAIVGENDISLVDPVSGQTSDTLAPGMALTSCRYSWDRCVAWSPDGQHLAYRASSHQIDLLSPTILSDETLPPPIALTLVDPVPSPLATLPDNTEPITVANASQLTLLGQFGRDDISDVLWSSDGSTIALLGTHGVWLYDDPTLIQPPRLLEIANGEVSVMLFSPDSHYLVLALKNEANQDFGIRFWDIRSNEVTRVLEGHTAPVTAMDFSADGRLLATGSADLTVRLWDVQTGQPLHVFWDHVDTVLSVDFNPDASQLVSAGDNLIRVWDVETGDLLDRFNGDTDYHKQDPRVVNAQFSPDGSRVFFYYLNLTWENVALRTWSANDTGQGSPSISSYEFVGDGRQYEMVFSPDGTAVYPYTLYGTDGRGGIWRFDPDQPFNFGCPKDSGAAAFSPDSATLAVGVTNNMACDPYVGYEPKTIWLWNMRTGERSAVLRGLVANVNRLVFSPDSRRLLSVSTDNTIYLWDVETGEMLRTLTEFSQPVSNLTFDPTGALVSLEIARELVVMRRDGQPIKGIGENNPANGAIPPVVRVIANQDYSVLMAGESGFSWLYGGDQINYRIWDTVTGERVGSLPLPEDLNYISAIAMNPAGMLLASSKGGAVKLWDITTREELRTLLNNPELYVRSLTFSPDERLLAGVVGQSGSAARAITFWDLTTGAQRSIVLPDPEANIMALIFSPDSRYIAAQTQESDIWILSLQTNVAPVVLHTEVEDIRHIVFSQDATLVALATEQGVQVWDRAAGIQLGVWTASSIQLAFNQDDTLLASGESDGTIKLWGVR